MQPPGVMSTQSRAVTLNAPFFSGDNDAVPDDLTPHPDRQKISMQCDQLSLQAQQVLDVQVANRL